HLSAALPAGLTQQQADLDRLAQLAEESEAPRRPYTGPTGSPPDALAGALLAKLTSWGVPVTRLKLWGDGVLVELPRCPWADEHTTGTGGAAGLVPASGAGGMPSLRAHSVPRPSPGSPPVTGQRRGARARCGNAAGRA